VAIRLRQPTQPDLIQRKLFSVHFHAYASTEYLKRAGTPRTLEELDNHRIISSAARRCPSTCKTGTG
jgi:DNA-binding transcriptional LysR family regulator